MLQIFILSLLTCSAHATPPQTIKLEGYEFRLAPLAFYDEEIGTRGGFNGSHLIPLDPHWQAQIESTVIFRRGEDKWENFFNASWGLTWNFSKNLPRSAFIGIGYGIGNLYAHLKNITIPDGEHGIRSYGYLDIGQRFQLTDSGSFSFVPMVSFMAHSQDTTLWIFRAINFAWNF